MKRICYAAALLVLSNNLFAQDSIRVSDLVDLEEKIMVKRMTDELTKPNPNAPPPPPMIVTANAPAPVFPTETLAIYGTSATYYEGQLSMGGRTYTVRKGTTVQEYTVSAIGPQGIELTRQVITPKKRGKKITNVAQMQTLFAPLATR